MHRFSFLFCLIGLSGCQLMGEPQTNQPEPQGPVTVSALGNVEWHTSQLADELLANLQPDRSSRIAVATFVPVKRLAGDQQQHALMILGHQLEQGMLTEVSRRGWIAQDYKVTGDIVLTPDSEQMFSRDPDTLGDWQAAEYFLSGTIVEQQAGAIVNARLIHARSKDVVAAATKFFPAELFWTHEKVTLRDGKLYRTQE